jgi:dipeptide/tripeptide permease
MTYNPIAILIFSILSILLLYFFAKIKNVLSIFLFIGIGMIVVAIGYFIPAYCSANITCNVSYMSALLPIIIIALGETFIGPFIALGFYHFSPAKVRGLFMGLYMALAAFSNSLLFIYAIAYQKHGAASTFKSIVIHILICAVSVFVFWFIVNKLTRKEKNPKL